MQGRSKSAVTIGKRIEQILLGPIRRIRHEAVRRVPPSRDSGFPGSVSVCQNTLCITASELHDIVR